MIFALDKEFEMMTIYGADDNCNFSKALVGCNAHLVILARAPNREN